MYVHLSQYDRSKIFISDNLPSIVDITAGKVDNMAHYGFKLCFVFNLAIPYECKTDNVYTQVVL